MVASDSVGIVGAGPAGLVTAKVFLDDGFDVTVYEKYDEIGGTWSSYRRYVNLTHQLGEGLFEFSDMPRDEAYEDAESIQAYLREYADRFDVRERIEFETEVRDLTETADGWTVAIRQTGGDGERTERVDFDYVAVCCGFHHIPNVPDVPGTEEFDGPVLHSSEVRSEEVLEDERVVIVGGGKSAVDIGTEAGKVAASTTLVFREANWLYPKKILGGLVPNRFVFYSRFGEALLPRYYNDDCVRLLDRIPQPIKDGMWSVIEKDLLLSGGLWGVDDLVPDRELPHDIVHTGILPDEFPDLIEDGQVTPKEASVERIEGDGVRLDTGEFLEADVIVFATGYRKEMPFLESEIDDLRTDDGRFKLYRAIVPPDVDDLGVVGLRQTFNNILTIEVTAHWLAAYFQGELVEMPSTEEMRETMERRLEWQERVMPGTKGYHYGPYDLHSTDELLMDMGIPTRRSNSLVSEYLLPGARARRYADLQTERNGAADPSASRDEGERTVLGSITSTFLP